MRFSAQPVVTETRNPVNAVDTAPAVQFVRSARARRYRLTLRRDGSAVATIPRHGSEAEARRFVERQLGWLARARARMESRPRAPEAWGLGTAVLWRGEMQEIRAAGESGCPAVALGGDVFRVARLDGNLRPALEAQFARRARIELPARAWELAAASGIAIRRVAVRSQRSRWGSCSAGGTISLNWRLAQAPELVRDYIIQHELAHRAEMNHSALFWRRVEAICPAWREAERWLKRHGGLLGF